MLTLQAEHVVLNIRIDDTGAGMSVDQQSRLFQRFAQADRDTAAIYGGSGLGLSICKQWVELMGGQISLAGESGQGTQVSVELPLRVTFAQTHEPTQHSWLKNSRPS